MTRNGDSRHPFECAQTSFPSEDSPMSSMLPAESGQIEILGRTILSSLSQTMEGEIIPRLMLAFDSRRTGTMPAPEAGQRLAGMVDDYIQLLLNHDASIATNYVATLRSDGIALPTLYLDLLAPAARRLGEMWEEDECSFTDVTIGVCRMHQVLLEFSRCFDPPGMESMGSGRNALIVPVPGEQHTFGLFMVMEFMRRGNWNCYSGQPSNAAEFERLASTRDFDMIGISVGASDHIDDAKRLIAELRKSAANKDAIVMVGGQAFLDDPGRAERIGADTFAIDGEEAVRQAEILLGRSGSTGVE
jgi:methanogenic corrinoid protein MtbC1